MTPTERILAGENIERVLSETAATPMSMTFGMSKLSSMVKSLKSPTIKASASSLVPKIASQGSSFSEDLGHDIELSNSQFSRPSTTVDANILRPGAQIGMRGPRHNGFHAVVSIGHGLVTLKNPAGREETMTLDSLKDHEVIHPAEML
jgi:hypothetical protein